MGRIITESGAVKAKAAPKLLRADLRALPSELVTNDVNDETKIHELDEPHVIEQILSDQKKARLEAEKPAKKEPEAPGLPQQRSLELTQEAVDVIRLRVLRAWASTQRAARNGEINIPVDGTVKHLWWPRNDWREYSMRRGNPPPDRDRPKHLRGLRIEIDISAGKLPETITRTLLQRAVEVDPKWAKELARIMNNEPEPEDTRPMVIL